MKFWMYRVKESVKRALMMWSLPAESRPWADSSTYFSVVHDPGSISHGLFRKSGEPRRDLYPPRNIHSACQTLPLLVYILQRLAASVISHSEERLCSSSISIPPFLRWFFFLCYRQLMVSDGEPGWCSTKCVLLSDCADKWEHVCVFDIIKFVYSDKCFCMDTHINLAFYSVNIKACLGKQLNGHFASPFHSYKRCITMALKNLFWLNG